MLFRKQKTYIKKNMAFAIQAKFPCRFTIFAIGISWYWTFFEDKTN